jgi:hypothetical protein
MSIAQGRKSSFRAGDPRGVTHRQASRGVDVEANSTIGEPLGCVDRASSTLFNAQTDLTPGKTRQTKVADATTEPDELTSFAPRRLPMSTWSVLENCPMPPWRWKTPTATVEPFSTWSLQVIGPL